MNYVLNNATVLTGLLDANDNMIRIENATVLVKDGKIYKVLADDDTDYKAIENFKTELEPSYEILDLAGKYVMPGLINAHVHLVPTNKVSKNKKKLDYEALGKLLDTFPFITSGMQILLEKIAREHLYSGCTTIRTVAGLRDVDARVRDKIDQGKIAGPRMIVCNTAISVPGGHMAGLLATQSSSVEEALRDLDAVIASHPDWIKLMITGGVLDAKEGGEPPIKMDPAIVKAVCERAHEQGFRVCAHVESSDGVRIALESGVDTIEHGAMPDEQIIGLFKEQKAADICTISPAAPFLFSEAFKSAFGTIGEINGGIVLKGIIQCADQCMENGIPVGLGTDCGCPCITQYDMWRELVYFHKFCHVSTAYAIHTATLVNAEILGIEEQTGSIEIGKDADLIVLSEDPTADLTVLRSPEMVMARGRLYREIAIKKDEEVEKELDLVLDSMMQSEEVKF